MYKLLCSMATLFLFARVNYSSEPPKGWAGAMMSLLDDRRRIYTGVSSSQAIGTKGTVSTSLESKGTESDMRPSFLLLLSLQRELFRWWEQYPAGRKRVEGRVSQDPPLSP